MAMEGAKPLSPFLGYSFNGKASLFHSESLCSTPKWFCLVTNKNNELMAPLKIIQNIMQVKQNLTEPIAESWVLVSLTL